MTRSTASRFLAFSMALGCIPAATVGRALAQQDTTWKLFNDLTVRAGSSSITGAVTLDSRGRMLGEPVMQIRARVNGVAQRPVFLRVAMGGEEYASSKEGYMMTPAGGTRSRLRFKSKELTTMLAGQRGQVSIDVRIVMAHRNDDGRWIVSSALTNTVSRPVSRGGSGVVITSVFQGSAATRVVKVDDGTAWTLQAGDTITHVDGVAIESIDQFTRTMGRHAVVTLTVRDGTTRQSQDFRATPVNGRLGVLIQMAAQ